MVAQDGMPLHLQYATPRHVRAQNAERAGFKGPARGQERGEGNVMNAAQMKGLQLDALRMSTTREGYPRQPPRQLRAGGLGLGDL